MPLIMTPAVPPDSLRRVVQEVFARPEYDWGQGGRPLHWLRDLWLRFVDWLGQFGVHHPVGFKLLFWGSILLLLALLTHLGFVAWRIYRVTVDQPQAAVPAGARERLDARGNMERAAALARAGRYTEALAHRFLALLLELDRMDVLTFHPSKTPAEYVREARLGASGRASLAGLVARLYVHVFGAEPCDEQAYHEFGTAAGTMLQHVASH